MNIKAEIKRLFPERTDNLKAAASLVLDGCFVIKNVRVIQGDNGLFMSLPARRNVNGDFQGNLFPDYEGTPRCNVGRTAPCLCGGCRSGRD